MSRPNALALASLAALLAVCAEPDGGLVAPEDPVLSGDSVPRGWMSGALMADGDDDDDDGNKFTGNGVMDCYQKCSERETGLDGWSTGCTCKPNSGKGGPWICWFRHYAPGTHPWEGGPGGDDGENGGGNGCEGGEIGGGELLDCRQTAIGVSLNCPASVRRGQTAECSMRPLNPDYDTEDTFYGWLVECRNEGDARRYISGDQCDAEREGEGRRYKKWSGKATMKAKIEGRVRYFDTSDSTLYVGVTSREVWVEGRDWESEQFRSTISEFKYPLRPKYTEWTKSTWGLFVVRPPKLSTWTSKGSGPWAGTRYLTNEPGGIRFDALYGHPDLLGTGPKYTGTRQLCDDGPSSESANLWTVNTACGTVSALMTLAMYIVEHERKHQQSFNACVNGQGGRDAVAVARRQSR